MSYFSLYFHIYFLTAAECIIICFPYLSLDNVHLIYARMHIKTLNPVKIKTNLNVNFDLHSLKILKF